MAIPEPRVTPPRPADNAAGWPALAALLAPGAGCDCQVLAVTLALGLDASQPRERPIAKR